MINGATATTALLTQFPIDGDGILLRPIDEHHVSLITPPLDLPDSSGGVASVRAALPGVSDAGPCEAQVVFLWQTEPGEGYRHQTQFAVLSESPCDVSFSLPGAASHLHRFGFQFRGVFDEVRIESIAIPSLSTGQRLRHAGSQVLTPEPIDIARVNFFRGPQILGHGLNYYLVLLIAAGVGGYALLTGFRGGRMRAETVVTMTLVCWLLADGLFTWNLMRQAGGEIAAFRGRSRIEQVALAEGDEIAWAYDVMLSASGLGEDFAVVSDDPFAPGHRLAYLLTPERRRRESYEDARFIVVIRAAAATYDGEQRTFRVGDGPAAQTELVAARSAEVYVLRRLSE